MPTGSRTFSGLFMGLVVAVLLATGCDGTEPSGSENIRSDAFFQDVDAGIRSDAGDTDAAELSVVRLNSVFPNRGSLEGDVRVRIVGHEFVEGIRVQIGLRGCRDVEIASESHLLCTVPPADQPGAADVKLEWPEQGPVARLEDGFTYFVPLEARVVEPGRGGTRGGYPVTILGNGFDSGTIVRFGDRPTVVESVDDAGESIVVRAPPGEPGVVDLFVRGLNGRSVIAGGFTYYEDLVVSALQPRYGSVDGGDEVLFAGVGLTFDSQVRFGDSEGEVIASELERQALRVRTPASANPGSVDISLSNPNGLWEEPGGFLYLRPEQAQFIVDGLAPSRVPTDAGVDLYIGGAGFEEGVEVLIDERPTACRIEESRLLLCRPAPHASGTVDVLVRQGDSVAHLIQALTYYERVGIFNLEPSRGSVAGSTLVEVLGEGLNLDTRLYFGEEPLTVVEVVDGTHLFALTPPNSPGWVSLRAETDEDEAILPQAFEYFDPSAAFGGVWGAEIEHTVNITALDAMTGQPLSGAQVIVIGLAQQGRWRTTTDGNGQATVSDGAIELPVSVTVAHEGYTTQTFERVTAENTTLLLMPLEPPMGDGEMEPIEPVTIRGMLRGLDAVQKPENEGLVLMAFVEISHNSPGSRLGAPPPRPNGILIEDGPYEIVVGPGEHAVVATAGYMPLELKDRFDAGQLPFWTFRDALQPVYMGVRRFVTGSPGDVLDGVDVQLDIPLNQTVQVNLINPSGGVPGAPDTYLARPILALGADGYFDFRYEQPSPEHRFMVRALPDMTRFPDPDVSIYWEGEAEQANPDLPYRISWASTSVRDMSDGVDIGPFVGTTVVVEPSAGGRMSPFRWVEWTTHQGVDGPGRPTEPADLHVVRVSNETSQIWMHIVPGAVNRFQFPQLPFPEEGEMLSDLPEGRLQLSVYSVSIEGPFEFDDFTFQDLGRVNTYSWSYVLFER